MTEKTHFENLAAIDCSAQTEQKNGLSYLSWAWAVDRLLRADPAATWSYGEPQRWNETVMVFCTVVAFGKPMTAQLPVMDYKNKAVPNPDAFAVNTAMQRCLVKAIAMHGLGLYIYAGEDLPYDEERDKPDPIKEKLLAHAVEVAAMMAEGRIDLADDYIIEAIPDPDELLQFWSMLDSKIRSALKSYSAIITAPDLPALANAWNAAPKHAHPILAPHKDKRKAALTPEPAIGALNP